MRKLFNLAFQNKKNRSLLVFILAAMVMLTIASQLEILSLGIITKKGPDFFELFAPKENGTLIRTDGISFDGMESRWNEIVGDKNILTKEDAAAFLSSQKSSDRIQQVINFINSYFPISGNLLNLALVLVAVAIFKAVTMFAHRFASKVTAIRVSRDLRLQYFEHIQSLPMEFYQQQNIGSLSQRVVGDSALIAEAVNACIVNYLQTPFTVFTTLALCFVTSWQLSLIVFIGFPLIILPIIFIAKGVKRISHQVQKNKEQFTSVLIDFLAGIQTVKVFAMEDFSLKKYREHNRHIARLEKKSARYDLSSRPIVHTIGMAFLSMALLYGLYVLKMSISETFFYCGLLYVFYEPIKKFAEENSHIQRGIAAADRMFEVMELKPVICDQENAHDLQDFKESIEFDQVSFRYADQWVLKNLSFKINKGETVAIVGPTGAGKSTIVQLLPRLYDVQEGTIRIDGQSIKEYTQKSIRENIAFVPQKPFLFLDTVAENISFGRNFSKAEIEEAASLAHADEFIRGLPNEYETVLAEAGKNLSGGQQQRLAIARALVKKAPILVMDEATSSLDNVSEQYIKKAIHSLRGKITQIIIAHRLSTIEDADKIIVLDRGEKVGEGTKEELLKTCPTFQQIWFASQRMSHV